MKSRHAGIVSLYTVNRLVFKLKTVFFCVWGMHWIRVFIYDVAILWAWLRSPYSDWLRAGRSGDRIPVGARFSAPVQTGPGAHPASCTMGTGSFSGVKNGRGVTLAPHPLLVPWSWKSRAIPLLPLWAVRPVQSLSACTRVDFTFILCSILGLWHQKDDLVEQWNLKTYIFLYLCLHSFRLLCCSFMSISSCYPSTS